MSSRIDPPPPPEASGRARAPDPSAHPRNGRALRRPEPASERIGIVAPLGRDAALLAAALERRQLPVLVCTDIDDLCARFEGGAVGVFLLTSEAFTSATLGRLRRTLRAQPSWSDVPVVVLTAQRSVELPTTGLLRLAALTQNLTVLDRPVRTHSLYTTLRFALRARLRQLEVRDLLDQLAAAKRSLEVRVEERTTEVRELSAALTLAEQEERSRIAAVLHDHLQQILFGIQLRLESLRAGSHAPRDEAVDRLGDLVGEAVDVTRSLTTDLSPPVLRGDGLASAMQWLADHMRDLHALHVEVEGECAISAGHLRTLLFQIVRELLFNVVKHAGVDRALVRLAQEGDRSRIEVIDQGRGFEGGRNVRGSGYGLASIEERLRLLGGTMDIDTSPGRGTHTRLEIPLGPFGSPTS